MSDVAQPFPHNAEWPQPVFELPADRSCWVALVGEEVAGVGNLAEAAQLATYRSRPRERIAATLWVPAQEPE